MSRRSERGASALKIVLIILGIMALLCAASGVIAAIVMVPRVQEKQALTGCADHLRQLGMLHIMRQMEADGAPPPHDGPALFVALRTNGTIAMGAEDVLFCPSDPNAPAPGGVPPGRYTSVDLDDLPAGLCSYAVRDFTNFPTDPEAAEPELLALCPHHPYGANTLWNDGSVEWMSWADLGVPSGAGPTFGPGSASPYLRLLIYE